MCPKVTEEHKEAVRDQILDAAERVFAAKGYHAASMDEIVRESRLSKGAIYGYFESKEDLFLALESRTEPATLEEMVASVASGTSAMNRLEKAGEIAVRHQASMDRDACRLSFEFWTSAPRIKAVKSLYANRHRATRSFLAGLIRDGIRAGEIRKDVDPDAVASILMGAVDGLTLHWATIGTDMDWDQILKTLIAVVRDGLLVPTRK